MERAGRLAQGAHAHRVQCGAHSSEVQVRAIIILELSPLCDHCIFIRSPSALSGQAADLIQCGEILRTIGRQQFSTVSGAPNGDSHDEGSGGESESETVSETKVSPDSERTHSDGTDATRVSATKQRVLTVVSEETSNQVVKEVLQYLHSAFSAGVKAQQSLSCSVPLHADDNGAIKSHDPVLSKSVLIAASQSNAAGKVLNALYDLFLDPNDSDPTSEESPVVGDKDTTAVSHTSVAPKTTAAASAQGWLVDSLSGPRTANTLELLNKVNMQCVRECSSLLRAAQHLRKVCSFAVSSTERDRASSGKELNAFSDTEEEEEEEERGDERRDDDAEDSSGSDTSSAPDPRQQQIDRLEGVSTVVSCTTLIALLGAVARRSVSNYMAWLEAQPVTKRTQKAVTVLEELQMKIFCVLQELQKIPTEVCPPLCSCLYDNY